MKSIAKNSSLFLFIISLLIVLLVFEKKIAAQVNPVPTTLNDFILPGSQPGESGAVKDASFCDNCHGGYDLAVEPAFNWRGSMMAQAQRDPIYLACLAISNQDAPEVGDLCIRCHTPKGWLEGRSTPTDGSALTALDREGVQCHFCHKMITPFDANENPYPGNDNYITKPANNVDATFDIDVAYLIDMTLIPPLDPDEPPIRFSANGMYICDDVDKDRRGPYFDAPTKQHDPTYSPYHSESAMSGTCHDVSNPVFQTIRDLNGNILRYDPNEMDTPALDFSPYEMFPVERTYSEWKMSAFNDKVTYPDGIYSEYFGGNKDNVSTCQDCHMKDLTGYGSNKDVPLRDDLPHHDMTGGNTFMPDVIASLFPGEVDVAALEAGKQRALYMLQHAATMDLTVNGNDLNVTVTNNTGHKLPSGYPEGRRIWVQVKAYNSLTAEVFEDGHYNFETGVLDIDNTEKIYEIKPGIGDNIAGPSGVNLPAGPSFHFVLNNEIFFDNRIPPQGFTNANFAAIQSPPVNYTYADGQNWDNTQYNLPFNPDYVEVILNYQSTSKEYVEFLRDENYTNDAGQVMYDKWVEFGRSAPEVMNHIIWSFGDETLLTWTGETDSDWNNPSNWDPNIAPSGSCNLIVPGNTSNSPVVSGTSNFCNYLTLETGAQLTVPTVTDLTINGALILKANSKGTASLVEFGNLNVSGFVESQFHVSENRWHYFASPLSNQSANPFYDLYLYSYDPLTGVWPNIVDETTSLMNGVGYKVWSPTDNPGTKTIVFRGPGADLHNSSYDLPITYSDIYDNYSFVGNPYPSAIDWDDASWVKVGIGASVYVWDGTQYIAWNGSTGDLTDGIIPALQGFFASDDGTTSTPQLTVNNLARRHGVEPYKKSESQNVLKLRIEGNNYYDNTFITFNEEATEEFDSKFDAFKILGREEAPQLYTLAGNQKLRINVLPTLETDYSVAMNLNVTNDNAYEINVSGVENISNVSSVTMEDKKIGVTIDLFKQSKYSFTAGPLDDSARFVIHFKYLEQLEDYDEEVSIYSFGDNLYVINPTEGEELDKIEVYNLAGQQIVSRPLDQISKNVINMNVNTGLYLVKIYTSSQVYSQKVLLQ